MVDLRKSRHIELVQRNREAVAKRFHVGFFLCPEIEKTDVAALGRQGENSRDFSGREETGGYFFDFEGGVQTFDVDAEFYVEADCVESLAGRMGEVELKRLAGEERFALRAVVEADDGGIRAEITGESVTEKSAAGDVAIAVSFELESSGARELVFGKAGHEFIQPRLWHIERCVPDVGFAVRERKVLRQRLHESYCSGMLTELEVPISLTAVMATD